jgi:hypothetical protein
MDDTSATPVVKEQMEDMLTFARNNLRNFEDKNKISDTYRGTKQ